MKEGNEIFLLPEVKLWWRDDNMRLVLIQQLNFQYRMQLSEINRRADDISTMLAIEKRDTKDFYYGIGRKIFIVGGNIFPEHICYCSS